MASPSSRICGDCMIPIGGQPTPQSCKHPAGTSQGTRPYMDSRVHDVFCWISSRFHVKATYIYMMTFSMSLMGLGATPLADDHSMPALLGEEDMDSD